jgi:hypothetical protein
MVTRYSQNSVRVQWKLCSRCNSGKVLFDIQSQRIFKENKVSTEFRQLIAYFFLMVWSGAFNVERYAKRTDVERNNKKKGGL